MQCLILSHIESSNIVSRYLVKPQKRADRENTVEPGFNRQKCGDFMY